MKSTGVVRKIDELGRIVIPQEIRDIQEIRKGTSLETYIEDDKIILKKYKQTCVFCGNTKELINYKDKLICYKCIKTITNK